MACTCARVGWRKARRAWLAFTVRVKSAPATVAIAEPQVALIRNSHVESSALLQESRLTLHREILR